MMQKLLIFYNHLTWKLFSEVRFDLNIILWQEKAVDTKSAYMLVRSHPRRPRGGQSGREKRRDESCQVPAKEPLGTDSHRTISKNSSRCRLLIGHKKCFVLLCPIGEQFLLSSFREFVHDGYCLDHGLSGSCTKEMHAVRKLSVWYIISPSDFKILSARKLKALFQKYKLQVTTGIRPWIGHVLRKYIYRELFKKIPQRKRRMEKWIHIFFSLYLDYSNSLTLSNASELLWSWISINHIQVHEENEFCHYLFTSFTKREIRHFTGSRAVAGKKC